LFTQVVECSACHDWWRLNFNCLAGNDWSSSKSAITRKAGIPSQTSQHVQKTEKRTGVSFDTAYVLCII